MATSNSMSYSAIDTAYKCPERYNLQYLKKIPQPGPESGDLHFGTAFHAAINACLDGGNPLDVFTMYWESIRQNSAIQYGRLNWEQLQSSAEALLSRFERLHAKNFEPVQMEERLYGTLGSLKIEGTPDFVGMYKGVPSIVDFKTSKDAYPKEKIQVNEQNWVYAHLAKQQLKFEAKQVIYIVFCKVERRIQVLKYPITAEKLESMLGNVKLMGTQLVKTKEFTRNKQSCVSTSGYTCPYFTTCYQDDKIGDENE